MEDLTDEFSLGQDTPLEHISPSTFEIFGGIRVKEHKYEMSDQDINSFRKLISKLNEVYADYKMVHNMQLSNNAKSTYASSTDDIMKCFREVPEVFFKSDFSLLNPDTFYKAMGNILFLPPDATNGTSDPVAAKQLELQKQQQHIPLAYCLDLVELALLRQICIKSPALFRTMDDIKLLQLKVGRALDNIGYIRKHIRNIETKHVQRALEIPRLQHRNSNHYALRNILGSMKRVLDGRRTIALLLQAEDYLTAMDIILELILVYNEAKLGDVICMKAMGTELINYEIFVCDFMANKFVSMAIQWLHDDEPVQPVSGTAVASGPLQSSSSSRVYMNKLLVILIRVNRL